MTSHISVAHPRIGNGTPFFVFAVAAFVVAFVCAMGATEGSATATGLASFFGTLTFMFTFLGFLTRLFGALERRLIDIEAAGKASAVAAQTAAPKPANEVSPVERFLG